MMVTVTCPECGAQVVEANGEFRPLHSDRCSELSGTQWFSDPGIVYCPKLSDAAPADWALLPTGYRAKVLNDIQQAKAKLPTIARE
jgi:endogenous inhibitor of DNA gyrase (YacG/DUF329 family)